MGNNKNFYKRPLLGYVIISFVIIFLISFIVLFNFQKKVFELKVQEVTDNEQRIVNLESDMLGKEFSMILSDLYYLHHAYESLLNDPENHEYVSENWRVFSTQRTIYDQIRYIDFNGDERIRVNYLDSGSDVVAKSDLQNKKDRYYFYETAKLQEEMIYVSQLDLNIERGLIETPYKPMIRFSTPVYDDSGNLQGIIVLNYLAENLLKGFRELAVNSRGEIALLNSQSYWISSDDNSREWNFMFDEKKEQKFESDHSDEWGKILADKKQFVTSDGLFTALKVNINHKFNLVDNKVDSRIVLGDGYWHIVSKVSKNDAVEIEYLVNKNVLIMDVLRKNSNYFILMTLISTIMGFLVYVNKKTYMKIKYYSEYDSLTHVFNRRAGFAKLKELAPSDDRRRLKVSLCYIDINGLKEVNDNLGHQYGDELIVTATQIIKSEIREQDFLMRLGGDEFLIVFSGIDAMEAEKVWQRIAASCDEVNANESRDYLISLSHGLVDFGDTKNNDIDDLIKIADEKMYAEKIIIKKDIEIVRK